LLVVYAFASTEFGIMVAFLKNDGEFCIGRIHSSDPSPLKTINEWSDEIDVCIGAK